MERAASERQATRAQVEHEIALQERAEHIARLRMLRLAKEAQQTERAAHPAAPHAVPDESDSET